MNKQTLWQENSLYLHADFLRARSPDSFCCVIRISLVTQSGNYGGVPLSNFCSWKFYWAAKQDVTLKWRLGRKAENKSNTSKQLLWNQAQQAVTKTFILFFPNWKQLHLQLLCNIILSSSVKTSVSLLKWSCETGRFCVCKHLFAPSQWSIACLKLRMLLHVPNITISVATIAQKWDNLG